MHVNQLAKALFTTPDTVRYYTRIGLLRPHKNERNAYKYYSQEDKERLRFILCARQMDFTVEEIAQLFAQAEKTDGCCPELIELVQRKLDDAQQRLAHTIALKRHLRAAFQEWRESAQVPTGPMLKDAITNFGDV